MNLVSPTLKSVSFSFYCAGYSVGSEEEVVRSPGIGRVEGIRFRKGFVEEMVFEPSFVKEFVFQEGDTSKGGVNTQVKDSVGVSL